MSNETGAEIGRKWREARECSGAEDRPLRARWELLRIRWADQLALIAPGVYEMAVRELSELEEQTLELEGGVEGLRAEIWALEAKVRAGDEQRREGELQNQNLIGDREALQRQARRLEEELREATVTADERANLVYERSVLAAALSDVLSKLHASGPPGARIEQLTTKEIVGILEAVGHPLIPVAGFENEPLTVDLSRRREIE